MKKPTSKEELLNNLSETIGGLKDTPRMGWKKRDVPKFEHVAAHSWGTAFLVELLCPKHLDKLKCITLAIYHDLVEKIIKDYTPGEISEEEKFALGLKAAKQLAIELNKPEIVDLFIEFEKQTSPEAVFVRQIDKLEAVLQAKYYDTHRNVKYYKENDINFTSLYNEFETSARETIAPVIELLEKYISKP